MKKFLAAAAAVVVMGWAGTARALPITIDAATTSFSVLFDGNVEQTPVAGLTSRADFTLFALSASSVVFDIVVRNTTTAPISSRVSALGFNTTPDVTGASATGGWNRAYLDDQFPNQVGILDACATPNNNCTGGGGGVIPGQQASFRLTLTFSPALVGASPSFTFDQFNVRYQAITNVTAGTSGTGTGCIAGTPGCGGSNAVPEPASMLLLGTGLLGLATQVRRRK